MNYRVICSAVLRPGAITQRVVRINQPHRDAKALIYRASQIAANRRRREDSIAKANAEICIASPPPKISRPPANKVSRRPGSRLPHPRSNPARPFRCISISVYLDDLDKIDAAVARLRADGQTKMSRSELLRNAFYATEEQ